MNAGRFTPQQDESTRPMKGNEKLLIKSAAKVHRFLPSDNLRYRTIIEKIGRISEKLGMKGSEDDFQTNPDPGNNAVSKDNIRRVLENQEREGQKTTLSFVPYQ